MFANLKKKLEEEVGDLSRLTSPMNLASALGDRRVGGSSQGTNTPTLGSRQSSVASLIDIGADNNRPGGQPSRPHPTTNSGQSSYYRDSAANEELQQLKKINSDLRTRLDQLRKSFEEKLQNQEADFAWRYHTKEDELGQLRNERDRLKEQVKSIESSWQKKYVRIAAELESLEGLSKESNAKLLNTQNDLQSALVRVAELDLETTKNHSDRDNGNILLASEGLSNGEHQESSNHSTELIEPTLGHSPSLEDNSQKLLDRTKELEEENKSLCEKLSLKHQEGLRGLVEKNKELKNEVQKLQLSTFKFQSDNSNLSSQVKELTDQVRHLKNSLTEYQCTNSVLLSQVKELKAANSQDTQHEEIHPPSYSDVNFMYLRSVLFKYLTASDPQVAHNLTRVVSTVLELKPDEEKLLRETQESQRSWFNSLIKK